MSRSHFRRGMGGGGGLRCSRPLCSTSHDQDEGDGDDDDDEAQQGGSQ